MGSVERKERLLENIFRLRHAERVAPRVEDLVAVRSSLEEELGGTVSRRLAARFLGVSHTALQRWIRSGDLSLVFSRDGRSEIPVEELLRLREAVDEQRLVGNRSHVLEPDVVEGKRRAERLDPSRLVPSGEGQAGHGRAERQSLAYHRALSKRLNRRMADDALHTVWKWRDQGRMDLRYARQWEQVLHRPVLEIKRLISADTREARDLRQNSPFAGMLSTPERKKILAGIR